MAKKHFENIIGKIIYGTLLFMPLLNVLGTSIYAIANKNAYESYYGETINEKDTTNVDYTELTYNNVYQLDTRTYTQTGDLYVKNAKYVGGDLSTSEIQKIDQPYLRIQRSNDYWQTYYSEDGITYSYGIYATTKYMLIEFEFYQLPTSNSYQFELVTYNKYSYLDNAFEYGIYKTENSPYYNWTTETAINDVIHQTTTTLGINNTFVDLLLTYWLLMTIIYVIYDLGLMLIQIAHKKVHKICDKD